MGPVLDESNIHDLVYNIKLQMTRVAPHEFQQIIGPFGPRLGYDDQDGIYFTEPEIRLAHRCLLESNILCVRVDSTVKLKTLRALIVTHNEEAMQKALRTARKEVNRLKGSIRIIRDLSEYS